PYLTDNNVGRWVKGAKKVNDEKKAALLLFIGNSNNESVIPTLKKSLRSNSEVERAAAVAALAKLSDEAAVPELLTLLENGNESDKVAVAKAFSTIKGDNVPALLTNALPNVSSTNKVAIINLLSDRAYSGSYDAISALLNYSDANVKKAAYRALSKTSRSKDLTSLLALLGSNTNGETKAIQNAIINVVENSSARDQDIDKVLSNYKAGNDQQKLQYLNVLSGI